MITEVSQYLLTDGEDVDDDHPRGDLNRIDIRGLLLCLYAGSDPYPFRGEDVAFLRECMAVRYHAPSGEMPSERYTFTRRISWLQLYNIVDAMLNSCRRYVKDESKIVEFARRSDIYTGLHEPDDIWPDAFYARTDLPPPEQYQDWDHVYRFGASVSESASAILRLEGYVNKLVRFAAMNCPLPDYSTDPHALGDYAISGNFNEVFDDGPNLSWYLARATRGGPTVYSHYVHFEGGADCDLKFKMAKNHPVKGYANPHAFPATRWWVVLKVGKYVTDTVTPKPTVAEYAYVVTEVSVTTVGESSSAMLASSLMGKVDHILGLAGIDDDLAYPTRDKSAIGLYRGSVHIEMLRCFPICTLLPRTVIV